MARILLLETATEVCSVALSVDGTIVASAEKTEGFRHSELVTLYVDQVIREWDSGVELLDAVCVCRGPGSYTGLRIGVSVAKGMCYALDIPLLSVSTLNAMASNMAFRTRGEELSGNAPPLLCPMIDARRMEVYTALFDNQGNQLSEITAAIIGEDSFADSLATQKVWFFGNGASKCQAVIRHPNAIFPGEVLASARFMSSLAEERFNNNAFENVSYFEPFYLKDFVATVPKNKVF